MSEALGSTVTMGKPNSLLGSVQAILSWMQGRNKKGTKNVPFQCGARLLSWPPDDVQ
jgi:hypothetical protein